MAVYYTQKAPSNGGGPTVGVGWNRNLIVLENQVAVTVAASDNANDDVGFFYAPAGFVVIGGSISAGDMDSTTTLALDFGTAATEDLFFAASAVGQAGTYSSALAVAGHFYKFTARTECRLFTKTATGGTPAAATVKVALWGFIDPDYNTTAQAVST